MSSNEIYNYLRASDEIITGMNHKKISASIIPLISSIRFRLFALIILFTLASIALLESYTLYQFEQAIILAIRHEGILLSNALEASIAPFVATNDVATIQAHIDRLVDARENNDIEINVLFLNGSSSSIVASNIPANIEKADEEEHRELLESLKNKRSAFWIEQNAATGDISSSHPDYYFSGKRGLNLITPLIVGTQKGGINVKLSLAPLDEDLNTIRWAIIIASTLGVGLIIVTVGVLLNRQIFGPLHQMRENMSYIADGDLNRQVSIRRLDEIGVLAQSFNSMAEQLARTRSHLHQYLNPMAIEEAYRRATDIRAKPLAQEKLLTVLFVDIVSFTSKAESLGPSRTVAYLNRYYDLVTVALIESGGYIDKFVADEIVCIFDTSNHAKQSVEAAAQILQILSNEVEGEQVQVRIGINTGSCIVADVGSQAVGKLDRTIIGDTVNVAQRLMTKAQPNTAILSEATFSILGASRFEIRPVGEQQLKGKSTPVMAYQLTNSVKKTL
jgi:class 3 adenylate cyclase